MNKTILSIALLLSAFAAAGQQTSRIEVEKGEKWWGVFAGGGPGQPFAEPFSVSTADAGRSPMMVSSLGRYVWSDEAMEVTFDGKAFTVKTATEKVEARKGGRTLREAYLVCRHRHCPPSGATAPGMPQRSSIFYETAAEFGSLHSAGDITAYASRLIKEGFPAGVMVLSEGWRGNDIIYDFDHDYYPDPKAFVDRMHDLGFKVVLTVTPLGEASGRFLGAALRGGMLLGGVDGKPLRVDGGDGTHVCLDVTRREVATQVEGFLGFLQRQYGVDGFRLDCSAVLPCIADPRQRAGYLGAWLALGCDADMCQWVPGDGCPNPTRMTGLYEGQVTGWESLAASAGDVLSAELAGCSGIMPLWGAVAGGGDELAARTLQFAGMLPASTVPFAPWRVSSAELYGQVLGALKCRASIGAYIDELMAESARTAEPMVRHMEYMFPRSGFSDCNDQFMIGSRYLVAPVLAPGDERMVRLPRGVWVDAHGKRYRGPLVISARTSGGEPLWFELSK